MTKNNHRKKNEFSSDRKKINPELMNKDNDNTRDDKNEIIKFGKSRENLTINNTIEEKDSINKFMKEINYFQVIKIIFVLKIINLN